jgi:hypothetical protein
MSRVFLGAAVVFLAWFPLAHAEVAQRDGVRVSVSGKMTPVQLPRGSRAPVSVFVAGHIIPTRPGVLPKLEEIQIAINRHGRLDTGGIPVCRLGRIDPSTTAEALAACGTSLVGRGRFSANLKIPEQSPFPSRGKVLAFNGKLRGKPALFAHIYGTEPVPTSYVLPFSIEQAGGTYASTFVASLPAVTGEWGYVTGIALDFDRRFVSASCPAPSGFSGAVFPLMRTSFEFEGGPRITSTLNRRCEAR